MEAVQQNKHDVQSILLTHSKAFLSTSNKTTVLLQAALHGDVETCRNLAGATILRAPSPTEEQLQVIKKAFDSRADVTADLETAFEQLLDAEMLNDDPGLTSGSDIDEGSEEIVTPSFSAIPGAWPEIDGKRD
jgi:hypothetical protein